MNEHDCEFTCAVLAVSTKETKFNAFVCVRTFAPFGQNLLQLFGSVFSSKAVQESKWRIHIEECSLNTTVQVQAVIQRIGGIHKKILISIHLIQFQVLQELLGNLGFSH